MKAITSRIVTGLTALAALCGSQAWADRYSDFWKPENMAKNMCASVHLVYVPAEKPAEEKRDCIAMYQEAVIEKSAPGTYFCCSNFGNGYIGVQELAQKNEDGSPKRVAIFSIWDAKDSGDNPHAAPEHERAKLVQRGAGVHTERFGGEGTGGKSMMPFAWKEGEVIRTLVIEKADGEHYRQIAGYLMNPETGQWHLLSCWRVQALRRGLGVGCGFVEDFRRNVESKKYERRATFGPAFRWDGKAWEHVTNFRFTKDGNPNMTINCRFNPARGYYSLATGGDISPEKDFPVFQTRPLPEVKPVPQPNEEAMKLIRAKKLETVSYHD